jgi:hypothetical protein
MAKKDNTHPILQEIKNTAKDHQAFEKERGKDLIYGYALDVASKKLVNVDWNTACAMAKKGTLSMHDEPIETKPMYGIHFSVVREGVLFPHQIKDMSRQMELGMFDGKGKTIIFPDADPLTKEMAEDTREKLKALVESGEMIDTAGMNDDEIVKAFYDLINKDKTEYTPVLIPANEAHSYFDKTSDKIEDAMRYVRDGQETHILSGTQSLSDFTLGSKKVFYSKRNKLMSEYEDLLAEPGYEEIPYEIESFKEMGLWAKKHGGTFFFPTSSIADLQNLSEAEKMDLRNLIELDINTKVLLGRNGDIIPFEFSTNNTNSIVIAPSGSGMSYNIEDLIFQAWKENPSFSEEEAIEFVNEKYNIQTVLDRGESMSNTFERAYLEARKYNGTLSQKNKSFVRTSNDKHAKAKFSARGR